MAVPDQDSILLQISCMRERSEQLCKSAAERCSLNGRVVVQVQMIHDALATLEAELRDGIVPDNRNQRTVLSNAEIDQLAETLARKLNRFVFVDGEESPVIVPEASKRPS
jgi:hypothetical protein